MPRTKEFRRPGLQGDFDDLVMSSRFFRFMCAPRDAWTEMEVRRTNNDNFYMGSDDKYGGRQDDLLPIGGKGENGERGWRCKGAGHFSRSWSACSIAGSG